MLHHTHTFTPPFHQNINQSNDVCQSNLQAEREIGKVAQLLVRVVGTLFFFFNFYVVMRA